MVWRHHYATMHYARFFTPGNQPAVLNILDTIVYQVISRDVSQLY